MVDRGARHTSGTTGLSSVRTALSLEKTGLSPVRARTIGNKIRRIFILPDCGKNERDFA